MVHNCAVLSCPLHNRRNIRKGLLFHSFPVDQHRFDLWRQTVLNNCQRTISINRHSKICHRHFRPDDYIANHTGLTRYLKATSVPSIFPETMRTAKIYSPEEGPSTMALDQNRLNLSSSQIDASSSNSNTKSFSKTKRLLSTIDKLHQIQNGTKVSTEIPLLIQCQQHDCDKQNKHNVNEIALLEVRNSLNENQLENEKNRQINCQQSKTETSESALLSKLIPCNPISSNSLQWMTTSSKQTAQSQLEDALYKFLQQANLLQYYSAFLEQGGDDLKQLAEAQNEDFQEIINLVGMASKPLHVKRFQNALANYRQELLNKKQNPISFNPSLTPIAFDRYSANAKIKDSSFRPSWISSKLKNDYSKTLSLSATEWLGAKSELTKNLTPNQLIDDSQRKLIADEAERISSSIPIVNNRKTTGKNQIIKDFFTTINLPRDFEDRWQRIRKFSAIYNRFDSKKAERPINSFEILMNEAAAAICFHRPEFLTRREELQKLAQRVLQNIGISKNTVSVQKRPLSIERFDESAMKQVKLNISSVPSHGSIRESDSFSSMWETREAKLAQIPSEIETFRLEQNKLLQRLKQNSVVSSSLSSNIELKRTIDEIGKRIEQLTDEERNLRRLIRKRNMRIRAKERQQNKHNPANKLDKIENLIVPILPITSSPLANRLCQEAAKSGLHSSLTENPFSTALIKREKLDCNEPELQMPLIVSKIIDKRSDEATSNETIANEKHGTAPIFEDKLSVSSTITETLVESNHCSTGTIDHDSNHE